MNNGISMASRSKTLITKVGADDFDALLDELDDGTGNGANNSNLQNA